MKLKDNSNNKLANLLGQSQFYIIFFILLGLILIPLMFLMHWIGYCITSVHSTCDGLANPFVNAFTISGAITFIMIILKPSKFPTGQMLALGIIGSIAAYFIGGIVGTVLGIPSGLCLGIGFLRAVANPNQKL